MRRRGKGERRKGKGGIDRERGKEKGKEGEVTEK